MSDTTPTINDNNTNNNEDINNKADTAPLPAKDILQKRLENKLLTRLTKSELIDKHIILSDTAPNLHNSAAQLERRRKSDMLANKLKNRPTPENLMQQNIIKAPRTVAPSLHEAQQALQKQKKEDLLKQHLLNRPTPRSLVTQNIIPDGMQPSPSLPSLSLPPGDPRRGGGESSSDDEDDGVELKDGGKVGEGVFAL